MGKEKGENAKNGKNSECIKNKNLKGFFLTNKKLKRFTPSSGLRASDTPLKYKNYLQNF